MAAKNGPAARCVSHRGMDSSFAGLGAARGWHLSGRFHRLSMRYDADRRRGGLVFRKRKRQTGALIPDANCYGLRLPLQAAAAAAADALDRVAGMIKKAVYRSSGRRIRTVGRRCRVRLCCMTALRCIVYGRCMSHDRCTFHGVRQVYAAERADAARRDVLLVGGSLGRAGRVRHSNPGAVHARAHESRCRQQHSSRCDRRRRIDGAAVAV